MWVSFSFSPSLLKEDLPPLFLRLVCTLFTLRAIVSFAFPFSPKQLEKREILYYFSLVKAAPNLVARN